MVIKNELKGFLEFLLERNIFQAGISFLIASQVNNLSRNIIDTVATPILDKVFNENIKNQDTEIFGIKFKTGQLMLNIINFLIVMIFIYYLYKLTNKDGLLHSLLNNVKENI
jgi:large-conductance mechanosensitive channel